MKMDDLKIPKYEKEGEFITRLLATAVQVHIHHLLARPASNLPMHLALDEVYKALPDMVDSLAESMQGKTGLLKYNLDYKYNSNLAEATSNIRETLEYVKTTRKEICQDTYIQNQIDSIEELFYTALYKLG